MFWGEEMDKETKIMEGAGLDIKTGIAYTGNIEKLMQAAGRYSANREKNSAKVKEFFDAEDYENYMIVVHSLKSNSRMIGATELAGDFEKLEMAARNNDPSFIKEKTAQVLASYKELADRLAELSSSGDRADKISADRAREVASSLLKTLDDFDDDKSRKLIKILSGYPFEPSLAGKLNEAAGYIDDFMYDEAAEIVKTVMNAI